MDYSPFFGSLAGAHHDSSIYSMLGLALGGVATATAWRRGWLGFASGLLGAYDMWPSSFFFTM